MIGHMWGKSEILGNRCCFYFTLRDIAGLFFAHLEKNSGSKITQGFPKNSGFSVQNSDFRGKKFLYYTRFSKIRSETGKNSGVKGKTQVKTPKTQV